MVDTFNHHGLPLSQTRWAANSPEDTDQNGRKSNFPSEAYQSARLWAGRRENISPPVEAEVFS